MTGVDSLTISLAMTSVHAFLLTYLLTDWLESGCVQGGVIVISIDWQCNLDWSVDYCLPRYSFSRLDGKDDLIARGSNFRSLFYVYIVVSAVTPSCVV